MSPPDHPHPNPTVNEIEADQLNPTINEIELDVPNINIVDLDKFRALSAEELARWEKALDLKERAMQLKKMELQQKEAEMQLNEKYRELDFKRKMEERQMDLEMKKLEQDSANSPLLSVTDSTTPTSERSYRTKMLQKPVSSAQELGMNVARFTLSHPFIAK
ncbi:hypothetical protein HDU76_009507, partial [Blyttiomyces sp. JEL0837]